MTTTVEFASPPSNIDVYVDAFHNGEEVWLCTSTTSSVMPQCQDWQVVRLTTHSSSCRVQKNCPHSQRRNRRRIGGWWRR
jgi:hypothetical protein